VLTREKTCLNGIKLKILRYARIQDSNLEHSRLQFLVLGTRFGIFNFVYTNYTKYTSHNIEQVILVHIIIAIANITKAKCLRQKQQEGQ